MNKPYTKERAKKILSLGDSHKDDYVLAHPIYERFMTTDEVNLGYNYLFSDECNGSMSLHDVIRLCAE